MTNDENVEIELDDEGDVDFGEDGNTGDFVIMEDEDEEVSVENIPDKTSPEWTDYVVDLFEDNELINKNPTCAGLRRLAEQLIGPIVEMNTKVVHAPSCTDRSATVVVDIVIDSHEGGFTFQYSGAADVFDNEYGNNCDAPYSAYPVATAETRAESRALKRALKLNVVAAEELSSNPSVGVVKRVDEEKRTEGKITTTQINFLEVMTGRLNLDLKKFVAKILDKNVGELQHADALILNETLTKYGQESDKIPEDIKL